VFLGRRDNVVFILGVLPSGTCILGLTS